MPICKKCNKQFPNTLKINGKIRTLNKRKYCLECSPFGQHNTSQIHKITDLKLKKNIRSCTQCKKDFLWKGHGAQCSSCYANKRRFKVKQKCIKYKGYKCEICGYDKCARALNFHHKDPTQKDFIISGAHCRKWEIIKQELDKCILLCANCHAEIHDNKENNQINR